jgi:hypothetical protein
MKAIEHFTDKFATLTKPLAEYRVRIDFDKFTPGKLFAQANGKLLSKGLGEGGLPGARRTVEENQTVPVEYSDPTLA